MYVSRPQWVKGSWLLSYRTNAALSHGRFVLRILQISHLMLVHWHPWYDSFLISTHWVAKVYDKTAGAIDLFQNAANKYHTLHNCIAQMCTHMHISLQYGAWWEIIMMFCGICATCLLQYHEIALQIPWILAWFMWHGFGVLSYRTGNWNARHIVELEIKRAFIRYP